jgi:uncharacterized protein
MKKALFGLLLTVGFVYFISVAAYYSPGQSTGFVNDYANLLTQEQKQNLESKLSRFEKETSNEVCVVIIQSLQGDTIENFAEKLFQEWGIGKENKDSGVLFLIAKDDRQMRIEVGYGLEPSITDAQSFLILENIVKPDFRNNDYYGGTDKAIDAIMGLAKGENTDIPKEPVGFNLNIDPTWFFIFGFWILAILFRVLAVLGKSKSWWQGGIIGVVLSIIIVIFLGIFWGMIGALILIPLWLSLDFLASKGYIKTKNIRGGPWWFGGGGFGGHGGSGGFGGFGGGSSGGGGSSSRW